MFQHLYLLSYMTGKYFTHAKEAKPPPPPPPLLQMHRKIPERQKRSDDSHRRQAIGYMQSRALLKSHLLLFITPLPAPSTHLQAPPPCLGGHLGTRHKYILRHTYPPCTWLTLALLVQSPREGAGCKQVDLPLCKPPSRVTLHFWYRGDQKTPAHLLPKRTNDQA